jgi:sec-independent protein translocase protein TatA
MSMAFLAPSPIELMVIAVIALLVLGPSRLPEAARSVGKGMREMKKSFQGDEDGAEPDEETVAHAERESLGSGKSA